MALQGPGFIPLGGHPVDLHLHVVCDTPVNQTLLHRLIRIDQLGVLTYDGNTHRPGRRIFHTFDHPAPLDEVGLGCLDLEQVEHNIVEALAA